MSSHKHVNGIEELLHVKVEDLPTHLKGGITVTINKDALLPEVLQLLTKHDIRSVPVVDKDNKLVGLIDTVDVIAFLVRFSEECRSLPAAERTFDWFCQQLQKSDQHVSQIAGLAYKNQLVPVLPGTSIGDIIQTMISKGLQRVPVVGENHKLENFVTQSSLVQFFAKHSDKLGKFGNQSLAELGFQPKHVFTIKEGSLAIDAFRKMDEHKITGVPIVDSEGAIITNVSSRDLRNALTEPDFFEKVLLPVERFVSDLKSRTFLPNAETMYPKICCKFTSKFGDVIHKLAATKIHRIYVVDDHERPVGVISLHDVIGKILELSTKPE